MKDLAVCLEGVGKTYPFFSLHDVHLQVPSGTILGFIGPNGAGKSTTLRILMGMIRQERGSVRVLGYEIPEQQALAKREVGFVSEDYRLYPKATLAWHMKFIASIFDRWDSEYAAQLLERFDLNPRQKIKGLSHGQRVKAALLLTLARRPRLMVLDEPTVGLDPVARQEVLGALMEILEDGERSILISSQNTSDIEQISDQIVFIDRGCIVESGGKEEFLEKWRRIRLGIPPGIVLPTVPGIWKEGGSERVAVLTVSQFSELTPKLLEASGAVVEAVERMTLEEIFVSSVLHRRERRAA